MLTIIVVLAIAIWLGGAFVAGSIMLGLTQGPTPTKDAVGIFGMALLWPLYVVYMVIGILRG